MDILKKNNVISGQRDSNLDDRFDHVKVGGSSWLLRKHCGRTMQWHSCAA